VSSRYRDQQPASTKNATGNGTGVARNTFNIASKFAGGAPYAGGLASSSGLSPTGNHTMSP